MASAYEQYKKNNKAQVKTSGNGSAYDLYQSVKNKANSFILGDLGKPKQEKKKNSYIIGDIDSDFEKFTKSQNKQKSKYIIGDIDSDFEKFSGDKQKTPSNQELFNELAAPRVKNVPKVFKPIPILPNLTEEQKASRERQRTIADPNAFAPLKWLAQGIESLQQTPVGKFNQRISEAENAASYYRPDVLQTSTGNKTADRVAELAGGALSFANPMGGGAVFNVAEKVVAKGLVKVAPKLVPKIAKVVANPYAQTAIRMGGGGSADATVRGVVEGKPVGEIVKDATMAGIATALLGVGGRAVGQGAGKLYDKVVIPKQIAKAKQFFEDVNGQYGTAGRKLSGPELPAVNPRVVEAYPTTYTNELAGPALPKLASQQGSRFSTDGGVIKRRGNLGTLGNSTQDKALSELDQVLNQLPQDLLEPIGKTRLALENEVFDALGRKVPRQEIKQLSYQELLDVLPDTPHVDNYQKVINYARENLGVDLDAMFKRANGRKLTELPQIKNNPYLEGYGLKPGEVEVVGGQKQPLLPIIKPKAQPELIPTLRKPTLGVNPFSNTNIPKEPLLPAAPGKPTLSLSPLPLRPKNNLEPINGQLPKIGANRLPAPLKVGRETINRGFTKTLLQSDKPAPELKLGLLDNIKSKYTPITNAETVARANKRVAKSIEQADAYVMNSKFLTAEHVTTAHRLIDEYQAAGNFERAVTIAERVAAQGTKAGQSIQAFSIYDRLSPQGILVHAQRVVVKANEKTPIGHEPIKLTNQTAAELTDLASTVQNMTGTKKAANDVLNIMERAKVGEKLTERETQTIKQFVNEANQFVEKVKPLQQPKARAPKPVKDARVRDNLVSFMDTQEQAARERIAKARGRISSTPMDIYTDYAIIGASKLAKGTVKFVDWAEAMVKDLGEEIRPHLAAIYDKAVEHLNLSTKTVSKKTISQAEQLTERVIKAKQLTIEDATTLRDLAQKISALSGDTKIEASQQLQAALQTLSKATVGQKVSTAQTIAQLLNPKTMMRNAVGNELFYRLEQVNKLIATPIDIARSKITGGPRQITFVSNNQGQYWSNWLKGWQAGWKGVNPEGIATQYDLRPNTFTSKLNPLTYLEKITGATLKSFDYAAYKRAVNHTFGEMGTLDAINKGISKEARQAHVEKFIRNADENLQAIADEYGRYVTFQDNNLISQGLTRFKKGLNFGRDFGIGDLVIKYPKTPGAILMRALEYSPAGILRSAYMIAKPWLSPQTGDIKEILMSLSRGLVGTFGITGAGYFLADAGILTGQASKDKDIRELQAMAGQRQYQVNLSALGRWVLNGFDPAQAKSRQGDTLINYDWAQPVAMAIAAGANSNINMKKEAGLGLLPLLYKTSEGGINTLYEQSVLEGVKRAFETNPGQNGVTDKVIDLASDLPASFVPTLSNQIRQYTDNTQRSTYSPDKLQETKNKAQNKIPLLAGLLPSVYDTLGKKKEVYKDDSNNLLNVFLNPAFVAKYNESKEAKLVTDVIVKTGDEGLAPRVPGKTITINGKSVKLTPEQYALLQKLIGEQTKARLGRISPKLSDTAKAKRIEKALLGAGIAGRNKLKKQLKEKGGA